MASDLEREESVFAARARREAEALARCFPLQRMQWIQSYGADFLDDQVREGLSEQRPGAPKALLHEWGIDEENGFVRGRWLTCSETCSTSAAQGGIDARIVLR
jgi:hypothetical protein